ncbi:MAG: glycosyltransferase [Fusobacterium sp.]|nr:glycosyltransferase [Fusobacterium sp.]
MKIIVVNNPAAKEGGALTILEQFLKKIYLSKRKTLFYFFVSVEKLKKYEKENIKVIILPKQNFIERILWDNFGLKKYLKKNKITPNLFISIQNTGVNINRKISQVLYYHQSLPLSEKKWSIFNRSERKFWMYKNIYPFFTSRHLNKTRKVIVQTNWVKEGFTKKFDYSKKKIFVIKPKVELPDTNNIKILSKEKFRIFYPAPPLIYKNHKIILEALVKIKNDTPDLLEKIECIFTFFSGDSVEIDTLIKDNKLSNVVRLIGKVSYEKVLEYYKSTDLLIFPSYIETLGLPLLEAKHFGLNIIAIDLPYSREVIGEYEKVLYFKSEDVDSIKNKILEMIKNNYGDN